MTATRRGFLSTLAAFTGALSHAGAIPAPRTPRTETLGPHTTWDEIRALFDLRPDRIHMSGLLFASHPRPVKEAIARHRDELQQDPASYISRERWRLESAVLTSASAYLGVKATEDCTHG